MTTPVTHIHIKSNSPRASADWWVSAFAFKIVADQERPRGRRMLTLESSNGIVFRISDPPEGDELPPGDAGVREGLEHFGFDSEDLDGDVARLTSLGATILETSEVPAARWAFLEGPDRVRIELIQAR
jgi:catechol 2,3-dioxygenase-like lactoylglutathione lyase family enzyme